MLKLPEVRGAIFDLDDTLLDNGPIDKPELWLHSRSRMQAIKTVATERDIQELLGATPVENVQGFMTAPVHSLEAGIWNIFHMRGMTPTNAVDPKQTELVELMTAIADEKRRLHEDILLEFGIEVPGATGFVKSLNNHGLRTALATSAIRRDVDIFIDKYNLQTAFPDERIVSIEDITRPKPDPECFDQAFMRLGLPDSDRRNVLAFEDNPKGIRSAKAAGLYVCAITTRYAADAPELLAAQPDVIADSYAEYREMLSLAA